MKKEIKEEARLPKVLFDTNDIEYSAYLENIGDTGEEENMADYYDWFSIQMNEGIGRINEYFKEIGNPVYVTGSLGLWDGRRNIYPEKIENWKKAFDDMTGKDTDSFRITQLTDTEFQLEAYHHDGRNEFHFRFLKEDIDLEEISTETEEQFVKVDVDKF